MERLIQYFETIPSSHRSLILVGGITFFWLVESAVPLFQFGKADAHYRKAGHAGINLFFTLTTVAVNFVLAFILLKTSDFVVAHQIGVLQWLSLPLWAQIVVGLLLLDLIGAWSIHWLQHHVKWMWRFHLIHHTDTYVDTTTANRHHPGESVFRFIFTTLAVLIAGTPIGVVMLYQALSVLLSQFNHANIHLPRWIDRPLNWFFVTPNMHHVHHHYVLPQTNTNYGNIFPFWDRLFGTYAEMASKDLRYGVDTHLERHEHSRIGNLLNIPFQPYRPPMGSPETTTSSHADINESP
ncbi:fatty acid hydroxylase family protein [Larkinella arboricola]|uniref:Fatty acid hydroxylase family protein n=1 Tax=Larkinella arboricola TaxID=643671 RepID=A0A327WWT8_LARAB|nr:sterol desaturase family protein [Larkinella arboricola]RAJ97629.1 fatty acid hydroxylase family protein [Larkinella arboricola]